LDRCGGEWLRDVPVVNHRANPLRGLPTSSPPKLFFLTWPVSYLRGRRAFLKAKRLIELIRKYGAVVEVGAATVWFGLISYYVHLAARTLVGK